MISSKTLSVVLWVLLVGLGALRLWDRYFKSSAEVIFWDVGQGDSILLKLPQGKAYLVDTGGGWGNHRIGEELASELADQGILHLNGLYLTHLDSDHASGSLALLRKLSIEKVFYPAAFEKRPSKLLKQIKAESQSKKVPTLGLDGEERVQGKGFEIKVSPLSRTAKKSNLLGLLLDINLYGCRFLLTGDMEKQSENEILKQIKPPYAVLKVAHHGSLSSSQRSFVSRVLPRFSVVSVGERNSYGHPKSQVLERLRYFKTQIFRTDFHGFISFQVDSSGKLKCTNALGFCGEFQC